MSRSIFSIVLALVIIGCLMQTASFGLADSPDPETSVVSLVIKAGENSTQDPLFELFDCNGYVLVPLNKLSLRIPLNLTYNREANQVIVASGKTGRQVRIELNAKKYFADNVQQWPGEPPLAYHGDFYVTPKLLEYLERAKTDWDPQYQELTISLPDYQPAISSSMRVTSAARTEKEEPLVYQNGPDFSLGSIRYELDWAYHEPDSGSSTQEGSLNLESGGRVGDWAISLGGKVNYEEDGSKNGELSLIRAKYNENNQLIIFGDSNVYFANTLRDQKLRGLLYMSPTNAFSRLLVPLTSLTGKAEASDKVTLFINGKQYQQTIIAPSENQYVFTNVPLEINRLNVLKVVIQKPSGACLVTEKKISSSLRLFQFPTQEWTAAAGYFRADDDDPWEDWMAGMKSRLQVTPNLAFESELARTEEYNTGTRLYDTIYGGDTGIAFRVGQNTICTLDWLVGGEAKNPAQGWQSSALYCLEHGFFKSVVFFVDPILTDGNHRNRLQTDPGKGVKFMGELEINDRTTYQGKLEYTETLPQAEGMDSFDFDNSLAKGEFKRNQKYGVNLENLFSLGLYQETKVADSVGTDLSRFYWQQEVYRKKSTLQHYAAYDYTRYSQKENGDEHELKTTDDFIRLVSDSFLWSVSAELEHGSGKDCYSQAQVESELKWINKRNSAGIQAQSVSTGNEQFKMMDLESSDLILWGRHYFSDAFSAGLKWDWDYDNAYATNLYYTSQKFDITYFLQHDLGKVYLEYERVSPYSFRTTPQDSFKLGIRKRLNNGLDIRLEAEKSYDTLFSSQSERVYRIVARQAFGIGEGRLCGIASDVDNLSFISGVVYLDCNGNSQLDPEDQRLSGIKLAMDGRRATTNKQGEYCFSAVDPGSYKLDFDLRSLSADYTPIQSAVLVKMRENENFHFNFGVTINGTISGKIFMDLNNNGIQDGDDKPLSWAGVMLDHGKKKVFSEQDGSFTIDNIPLGKHNIQILAETLPKNMKVKGESTFDCSITPSALDVRDISIPVVYQFQE